MKHLIFIALCVTTSANPMDKIKDKHWLQERIEKCKEGKSLESNCRFMKKYIARYYLPICGGQLMMRTTSTINREMVCGLLDDALVDERFVSNIID